MAARNRNILFAVARVLFGIFALKEKTHEALSIPQAVSLKIFFHSEKKTA